MADDIADFVGRKPSIDSHSEIVKPKLGFFPTRPDVNMPRFITLV
jgi:hypothetical protein